MKSSLEWRQYFERNADALLPIPWELGEELTAQERRSIASSVQGFQAGESSEGRHIFHYADAYAKRSGDSEYSTAVRKFIAEEHRHARDLKRFLLLNGIPVVKSTLLDAVFRKLRNLLGGLECSIAVLITAEIIAKVYYAALRDATQSRILIALCNQILQDEEKHVEFQAEQLAKLRVGRGRTFTWIVRLLQRFLFWGTLLVVWPYHAAVIRRGGFPFQRYWRESWKEFNAMMAIVNQTATAQSPIAGNQRTLVASQGR